MGLNSICLIAKGFVLAGDNFEISFQIKKAKLCKRKILQSLYES